MNLFVVFTLCILETNECETHYIPAHGVNELTCISQSQTVMKDFLREGMYVKKYGCVKEK